MASSDSSQGPSTSLTAAALKAHDEHLSKTSEPDQRYDPLPSGTRCLALAEGDVTGPNGMGKKHVVWAASQIEAFNAAFQTPSAGD